MGLVFKNLKKDNIKITPYTAHKQWISTDSASASSLGIRWYEGKHLPGFFSPADPDQGDASTEEATTFGQYKKLVHASIDRLYYDGADSAYDTYCNTNPVEQIRELNDKVTVISIPQQIFGDEIKPGSFEMTFNSGATYGTRVLKDDGQGNIIDTNDTYSYMDQTSSMAYVGYWENFKYTHNFTGSVNGPYSGYTSLYWPRIETRVDGKWGLYGDSYNTRACLEGVQGSSYYGAAARYMGWSAGIHSAGDVESLMLDENVEHAYHEIGQAGIFTITESVAPHMPSHKDMAYTVIRNSGHLEFNDDFCIAARYRTTFPNIPQSWSFSGPVDEMSGRRQARYRPYATLVTKEEWFGGHCPFSIYIDYSNTSSIKVAAKRRSKAGGQIILTSSASPTSNTWQWVIFQKTGSELQLFTSNDGWTNAQAITASDPAHDLTTTTKTPIHIGARRYGKRAVVNTEIGDVNARKIKKKKWKYVNHIDPFRGYIDEVHIFDRAMNKENRDAYVYAFTYYGNNNNRVGNIMYEHGIATITTPTQGNKSMYHDVVKAGSTFFSDMRFKGSHDLTEHIYICNVLDGEYNSTENITVRQKHDPRNDNLQALVTRSEWSPYITTVGLYDKQNNLCAVGKMAQAIKNPADYDLSFMVRFDTNPH